MENTVIQILEEKNLEIKRVSYKNEIINGDISIVNKNVSIVTITENSSKLPFVISDFAFSGFIKLYKDLLSQGLINEIE